VPAKYNQNTELKETVTSGSQTIDFKLDSKGAKPSIESPGGGRVGGAPEVCGVWEDEEEQE
jgi:hypothetical protein